MVATKKLVHKMAYLGLVSGLVGGLTNANAAAFQIQEQNVSNLGNAYAGAGSYASDASTAFYNPAGLTRLEGKHVSLANNFIHPHAHLRVSSATATFPVGGVPVQLAGNMDDDPGGLLTVPAFHYSVRMTEGMAFGFSVSAPFGLKTDYSLTSPARYVATKSKLTTVDFKPSFAFKVAEALSIAVSLDVVKGYAQLNSAIGNGGATPDGHIKIGLKDVGYGYSAAMMLDINERSRVGLSYRSPIVFHAKGERKSRIVGPGFILDTTMPARSKLTIPDVLLLSYYNDIYSCWALMADVQFTKWKRFRTLKIDFPTPPSIVVNENFRNSVRSSLGLNYTPNTVWTFKGGVSLDNTPVVELHRTARVPDSDRIWGAFGARYNLRKHISIDAGYAHLFFKKARINELGQPGTVASLVGKYDSSADILGLQLNWSFSD